MRLERADLLQIYYLMRLTRAMEDRTRTLFLQEKGCRWRLHGAGTRGHNCRGGNDAARWRLHSSAAP